jgi:23S rRNA pseudouridine1911/1915/1917 synthase
MTASKHEGVQRDAAPAAAPGDEFDPDPADDSVDVRDQIVDPAWHGLRLDKALVELAPEFSRSHLQSLIERGHVSVDGELARSASRKLRVGQRLRVELVPTAQSQAFRPEPIALTIVFEDESVLVVDKPAGLVVHPAAGHWSGTLLNALLAHHGAAMQLPRAGIVHRLDKDTSGLMVVAKSLPAMTALVRAIAAREVQREYRALVHGKVAWKHRQVDAPIGRDPKSRIRMAVVANGKPARTEFERIGAGTPVSRLLCRLHTGRTHQIRVHLASCGHPIVADAVYGGRFELGLTRQALHASSLAFAHPVGGQAMRLESPLPADMAAAWTLSQMA